MPRQQRPAEIPGSSGVAQRYSEKILASAAAVQRQAEGYTFRSSASVFFFRYCHYWTNDRHEHTAPMDKSTALNTSVRKEKKRRNQRIK